MDPAEIVAPCQIFCNPDGDLLRSWFMNPASTRLIFVYNADGGLLNALKDAVHKIASPATYPCSLCALTYGWVSMRGRWRRFLASLTMAKVFHHRDDFALAFAGLAVPLPAILLAESEGAPQVLISAPELDVLPDLQALIALVEERLVLAQISAPIRVSALG